MVAILAPHGGRIEAGTTELATSIAGEDYSLFVFEGLKPPGQNPDLHITSHRFDHPACISLVSRCSIALAIHGCIGKAQINIGGLDVEFTALLGILARD